MSERKTGAIRWGPQSLRRAQGTEHFLLVGASGSGKTTLLKTMMQSIFASETEFTGLIYDPKQELLPFLFLLAGDSSEEIEKGIGNIRVLNPFDKRCSAWNLSKDIDNPVSAKQLATILVPESKNAGGGEQFFINAVRDILAGVMLVFINCAKKDCNWTLRDLLLGVLYQPYLRVLLQQTLTRDDVPFPLVHRLKKTYLDGGDSRTLSNILATISTKLSIFEPVAASWHEATKNEKRSATFSLKDWSEGKYTEFLVLGNDEAGRAAIDPINQAIFKRATELLLARKETTDEQKASGNNQTWFFLDEVREAGMLDGLSRLLTKGRSKGACVVLAFQDIEGMRDVYGNEVANEICGQCNNTIILRLNSPTTAQWASELFGKRIALSMNAGAQTTALSTNTGFQEQERPFLMTSDFTYLPTAGKKNGVTGYIRNPEVDPDTQNPKWHLESTPQSNKLDETGWFAPEMPVRAEALYLKPWTEKDWDRLGFRWPFHSIAQNNEEAEALGLPMRFLKPAPESASKSILGDINKREINGDKNVG